MLLKLQDLFQPRKASHYLNSVKEELVVSMTLLQFFIRFIVILSEMDLLIQPLCSLGRVILDLVIKHSIWVILLGLEVLKVHFVQYS